MRGVTLEADHLARRAFVACVVILVLMLADSVAVDAGPKSQANAGSANRDGATYRGGLVTPPLPKPRFTLTDTAGVPFDFRAATDGYVTLLLFGYTHCVSICPTQMSYLAGAIRRMPKEGGERF